MLLIVVFWCFKVYLYRLGFSHLDLLSSNIEWDLAQTLFLSCVMAILDIVFATHIREDGPDLGSKKGLLVFVVQVMVINWIVMSIYYIVYYSVKNWIELPDEPEKPEEEKK